MILVVMALFLYRQKGRVLSTGCLFFVVKKHFMKVHCSPSHNFRDKVSQHTCIPIHIHVQRPFCNMKTVIGLLKLSSFFFYQTLTLLCLQHSYTTLLLKLFENVILMNFFSLFSSFCFFNFFILIFEGGLTNSSKNFKY